MTNLENLKKLAENVGADASKCSTNLGALNVISAALGGAGDAQTNSEAIFDIVGASLDEMASPAMLKGIIDRTVTEVVIPEGTTVIGESVFSQCRAMERVTIPESVETIMASGFMGCSALTGAVKMPNVASIGRSAFGGCANVESYYLSNKLHDFATDAFGGNSNLKYVYATGEAGELPVEGEYDIGEAQFGGDGELIYAELPEGVRTMSKSMFGGCRNLETVIVHDNLKTVKNAFAGNSKLHTLKSKTESRTGYNVIFPNSVTTIGADDGVVFGGCSAITSVFIPASVTSINSAAFSGAGITKIDIDLPENAIEGAPWGATNAQVNWLG